MIIIEGARRWRSCNCCDTPVSEKPHLYKNPSNGHWYTGYRSSLTPLSRTNAALQWASRQNGGRQ